MRSPKLTPKDRKWFHYHAGYSQAFVEDILADNNTRGPILDPWNGSGTTTVTAWQLGIPSIGFDINPSTVVVAKARLLGSEVKGSLASLALEIKERATSLHFDIPSGLSLFFAPQTAQAVASLARAIEQILVDSTGVSLSLEDNANQMSSLAAHYYVALFRTSRTLLRTQQGSNPTWTKIPDASSRINITPTLVYDIFLHEEQQLAAQIRFNGHAKEVVPKLSTGISESLALDDNSVSTVISSPPYCTRIDYVRATMPELISLGADSAMMQSLGRGMTGTTKMLGESIEKDEFTSRRVRDFLINVRTHPSVSSSSYYSHYFIQYYQRMWKALGELERVLNPSAFCYLVVQDSWYKDIHCDLASHLEEMAIAQGLTPINRVDFPLRRTMAAVNVRTKRWRQPTGAVESVLVLRKE